MTQDTQTQAVFTQGSKSDLCDWAGKPEKQTTPELTFSASELTLFWAVSALNGCLGGSADTAKRRVLNSGTSK